MTDKTSDGLGIEDIFAGKREQVKALAQQHGASNLHIFGSVARGEARADSDIDLLVEWDYERMSPWGGAGLYEALESLLGHPVDIATLKQLRPRIKERVLAECIPL